LIDLIQHFFAKAPLPSSSSSLSHVSPHLTISLPYLPISPPTFDRVNTNSFLTDLQNSTSAKSLAIFHLPILAVNTLPRSNWSLSITEISPLSPDSSSSILAKLDPKLFEENSIEIWTADLQWTLRFGSINASTTGVDEINPSLAYRAGSRDENYDDWVSVGENRKVELVFTRKKDRGEQKEMKVREDRDGTNKEERGRGKLLTKTTKGETNGINSNSFIFDSLFPITRSLHLPSSTASYQQSYNPSSLSSFRKSSHRSPSSSLSDSFDIST